MKTVVTILFLFAFVAFSQYSFAQLLPPNQPEQDACNALVVCGNTFTTPYSYQGNGLINDITSSPCNNGQLAGEDNSMWLRLNVNTGGIIVFTITPINPADDYDFLIVNITNNTCSTFTPSNVIRCNFNNNLPIFNNGVLGLNTTSTVTSVLAGLQGSYLQQINASAGDVYLIMINNFGQGTSGTAPTSGFTIDFTGSTATFNGDNPSLSNVIPSCNSAQVLTVQMSENIKCSSIASNGSDFTVSGGGVISSASGVNCSGSLGYTDKVVLNFASSLPPGNYVLGVQVGTDGNGLLNLCDHDVILPDTIQFTIPPYAAPAFVAIDTPGCSEIKIKMNTRIRCDSLAKNGSDFSIQGPQPNNVVGAYGIGCDTLNFTDTVVLLLQNPIHTDGVYSIVAKNGTDGNTEMDSCGLKQAVGDAITLVINSYDGQIVSTPDTILCKAQYLQLNADNYATPPLATVNCDTNNTACNGTTYVAFVGGKDSLSDINSPFFGAWQDARAQYLFTAAELRAMGLKPGSIHQLQWKVTQKLSSIPYTNFTIKIGCTPLANLTGNFNTVAQTVYSNPSYSSVLGWNTFNLSTPYNWDGVSNLIVEVCYDNTAATFNDQVSNSMTNFASVLRRYMNNGSGCAITTQGTAQASSFLRPKLRFYICEPPSNPLNYAWSPGVFLSDSTIKQPLAFINNNIVYHVATEDKYGCMHRDSSGFILSIRDPKIRPTDTTVCYGEKVLLQASGAQFYNWYTSDITTMSCTNCTNPVVHPLQTTVYSVIISDQYNCADTLDATVHINPLPPVTIYPRDTIVKYGTVLQLTGSGASLYSWSPPGVVSDPNITNPTITVLDPEVIVLTGIDNNACRNFDTIRITVDYTDPVFIPSAFSPNGDGKNDVFKVGSMSFQKLVEFRIFNRWGQQVFSTTNANEGWDGTFNGQPQDPGVYNYIIRLAYPNGKVQMYKGSVTLIR